MQNFLPVNEIRPFLYIPENIMNICICHADACFALKKPHDNKTVDNLKQKSKLQKNVLCKIHQQAIL